MLRIHFTSEDLARTQVATAPDPLWEIVMSLQLLRSRRGGVVFQDWRRASREAIDRTGIGSQLRMLSGITPVARYFPDFLTPLEGTLGLDEGIAAVLATPSKRVRRELELLDTVRGTPAWAWDLAAGRSAGLRALEQAVRVYHRIVLTPFWPLVQATLDAHRAPLLHARRTTGVDGMLADLWPALRWHRPVLEAHYFKERDIHLQGQGITLIPSFFCWKHPVPLYDPELPPVVVYPVTHLREAATAGQTAGYQALDRLIGRTRGAVLRATVDGATTSDLARRCGISPATASQHAAVLRECGVVTSHRRANMVVHFPTALGLALLASGRHPPARGPYPGWAGGNGS